jgi:hypothetical protein
VERRLREAARLGFDRAIVPRPARSGPPISVPGLEIVAVGSLREAVEIAFATGPVQGAVGGTPDGTPRRQTAAAGPARC